MNENLVAIGIALIALTIIGAALSHFWPQIQEAMKARETIAPTPPQKKESTSGDKALKDKPTDNDRRIDAFGKTLDVRDTITELTAFDPQKLQQNTEILAAALTQTKGTKLE